MPIPCSIPNWEFKKNMLKQFESGQIFVVSNSDARVNGKYYISVDGQFCKEFEQFVQTDFGSRKVSAMVQGEEAFYSYMLAMSLRTRKMAQVSCLLRRQENIKVDTILVHRSFRREMFEKVKRRFERSLSINKSETIEEMDEERLETLYHNLLSDRLDSLIAKREMSDLGSVHTKKAIKMI